MLGPGADEALTPLASPEIRQRVLLAHLTEQYRRAIQRNIGLPLGRALFRRWMQERPGSRHIEEFGLPRHTMDEALGDSGLNRSEEHTYELQSLMRKSYAVLCLKKTKKNQQTHQLTTTC